MFRLDAVEYFPVNTMLPLNIVQTQNVSENKVRERSRLWIWGGIHSPESGETGKPNLSTVLCT
jgi:hypothetical protein